jgi:hypothetical protein
MATEAIQMFHVGNVTGLGLQLNCQDNENHPDLMTQMLGDLCNYQEKILSFC